MRRLIRRAFELADGGTLFHRDREHGGQAQRSSGVLQTGEFPAWARRVRCARTYVSSRRRTADINAEITGGRLRRPAVTPQYREIRLRRSATAATTSHALPPLFGDYSARYRKTLHGFDDDATAAMQVHGRPGNVRELQHAVERAVSMARTGYITSDDLGFARAHPETRPISPA
jgi:hypothetical protein